MSVRKERIYINLIGGKGQSRLSAKKRKAKRATVRPGGRPGKP